MTRWHIVITKTDRQRMEQLLDPEFAQSLQPNSYLTDLQAKLQRAQIVDSADVPVDVITMESAVRLRDMDTNAVAAYTLDYPDRAIIAENKLSMRVRAFGDLAARGETG